MYGINDAAVLQYDVVDVSLVLSSPNEDPCCRQTMTPDLVTRAPSSACLTNAYNNIYMLKQQFRSNAPASFFYTLES